MKNILPPVKNHNPDQVPHDQAEGSLGRGTEVGTLGTVIITNSDPNHWGGLKKGFCLVFQLDPPRPLVNSIKMGLVFVLLVCNQNLARTLSLKFLSCTSKSKKKVYCLVFQLDPPRPLVNSMKMS